MSFFQQIHWLVTITGQLAIKAAWGCRAPSCCPLPLCSLGLSLLSSAVEHALHPWAGSPSNACDRSLVVHRAKVWHSQGTSPWLCHCLKTQMKLLPLFKNLWGLRLASMVAGTGWMPSALCPGHVSASEVIRLPIEGPVVNVVDLSGVCHFCSCV